MTATTDLLNPGGAVSDPEGPAVTTGGAASTKIRGGGRLFWERFREDKAAVVAAIVIFLLILIAIDGGGIASWVTGHQNATSYQQTQLDEFGVPKGPDSKFVFGVDGEGRDLL